jgi:hypothetical protein
MTIVIAKFDIEGFHSYPSAPSPVEFLSHRHRHTFKISVGYKVSHSNREREIFICRDEMKSYLIEAYGSPCEFGSMSCEMIASELIQFGADDGVVWCEVLEEETGGARVEL